LELNAAVSRASAGDLTVKIQPAENPEMALLIDGFNSLITRLKDTHQKLYSTTNDVTMAIKQINLIIGKVTEGTHNQASATAEVIISMEGTDEYQKEILESSQNLEEFSNENLSSLMQIKSALMGLLISGGMLIPGNIPNIVAAGRLGIRSKEWARIGVPMGLVLMIVYFALLFL